MKKTVLTVGIEYDETKTDPEGLANAMDRIIETCVPDSGMPEDYGNPKIGKFFVQPVINTITKKDFGCLKVRVHRGDLSDDGIRDHLANIEEIGLSSFVNVDSHERTARVLSIFFVGHHVGHLIPKIKERLELPRDPDVLDHRHITDDEWDQIKELLGR